MKKTIRSSNPKYIKWILNYIFWVLLIISMPGIFVETKGNITVIVIVFILFLALFWYQEFRIKKMPLVQMALKARRVSIRSHLFIEVDKQKIPFDQIEQVEFVGLIDQKMIASKVFLITLNKAHPNLENPILFIEWRTGPLLEYLNPSTLSSGRIATKIQEVIDSRN